MKNKRIIFSMALLLAAGTGMADDVILTNKNLNQGHEKQRSIPVDVDIDRSLLGIHFRERVEDVNVSVTGPDGTVYSEWFTTPAARSVEVDLSPYRDGQYEIFFFDAEGNEAEGSFLKEED